jgi:hypothetical protein
MANFVLVYGAGGSMPATEEERQAVLQAWTDWYTKLGSAVVDPGNPFTPMAKRIARNGRVSKVGAGAMATGYTILSADSLDAAVEMAKDCPVLRGGSNIAVYETFSVM